jgi:flagellar hook assembly protein FlgD
MTTIDPHERSLKMPAGPYELGIAIQDRQFYENGQLYYPANARLCVCDVTGREVKTLVAGAVDAGPRQFAWDGTNAHGSRVAAGVYIYKLVTELGSRTGRVTLVQ